MDAERLLALIGKYAGDTSVEAAFVELHTRRRPELDPEDEESFYDWVLVRRQGVELGFVEEAYFLALEKWRRRRKGVPLLLFQLYFYSQRDGIADFSGRLPFGLALSDSREQVRHKLSHYDSARRSYVKDTWYLPDYLMVVGYKETGSAIDMVFYERPANPWPERGRLQPPLSVADFLSLFGQPAKSIIQSERFRPLDLAERIEEDEDEREVDFTFECGLEIFFTESSQLELASKPSTKEDELVFGAARFYRSRERDARQWAGELPLRLSFDDAQGTILEKIGRQPDKQEDEDMSGFALWHFAEFSVQVVYSNMENRILTVSFMAPGFWTEIE